ncbi:Dihydropteroate synthase [Chishuiella changwenlii]|uniref:Dihydropteroate synthase n=1 Tax=Chishuiella changwenlii TaxID=1434701 RepID=A0A1M6WIC4_9FLAO|nr:dihydropteroate synthase [Chishuiella changwenlii]GGF04779.1 dihydropteroate synthase [Chishuiella changwenlii]SHK93285.1 Dihydropteroate synthase [Chishuiella changwenlii]
MTINCNGRLIDLNEPKIMGILNTTPNSFYDGGRHQSIDLILEKVSRYLTDGADIIDIGGYSTKPGAEVVSEQEEIDRTAPIIEKIIKEYPEIIISIDTFRGNVAREAINAGASIINDVSGWELDNEMFNAIVDLNVPYILMHMQGTPQTMQDNPVYKDITLEVNEYFSTKITQLKAAKVNDIILDPGFGFAKTLEQNYELFNKMESLGFGKFPLLVGISRKSMIYNLLSSTAENALNGTSVLNMVALQKGAKILRVHDVKEANDTLKIYNTLKGKY